MNYVRVPWYDGKEFRKAYQALYSEDLNERSSGVALVSAWDQNILPAQIEATVMIVKALNSEEAHKLKLLIHSNEREIRLNLACAIARFVTAICDSTARMGPKQTYAEKAKEMGIPQYIVDLRLASFHSALPELGVLRMAAGFALKYLKDEYWEERIKLCEDHNTPLTPVEEDIRVMLQAFKVARRLMVSKKRENQVVASGFDILIRYAKHAMRNNKQLFLKAFCEFDIFFKVPDANNKFLDTTRNFEDITQIYHFWEPLLHIIFTDSVHDFVCALLTATAVYPQDHKELAMQWAWCLFEISLPNCTDESLFYGLKVVYDFDFKGDELINAVMLSKNKYTKDLLEFIAQHVPDIDERRVKFYVDLLNAAEEVKTEPDILDDEISMDATMAILQENLAASVGDMQITHDPSRDWSKIPLGHVFPLETKN